METHLQQSRGSKDRRPDDISMIHSPLDGMYWITYASKNAASQNIYVKPLKLSTPIKKCEIVPTLNASKANRPFILTAKFCNNYGELSDPIDISFGWHGYCSAGRWSTEGFSRDFFNLNPFSGLRARRLSDCKQKHLMTAYQPEMSRQRLLEMAKPYHLLFRLF